MHVVAEFLVLQHILSTVPGVSGDGAVDGGAGGVFVAADCVDHEAVQELVGGASGLGMLECGEEGSRGGLQVGSWRGHRANLEV